MVDIRCKVLVSVASDGTFSEREPTKEEVERAVDVISDALKDDPVPCLLEKEGMHREYTHALLAMCMSFDEGILFETGDFECCAFVHLSKDDGSKQMTEAEYKEMEEDLSVCELQNMIKPEYHAHLGDFDALLPVARRLCVKEHGPVNNIFLMGSHTRNQGLGTRLVRGIKGYSARQGRGTFAEVSNERACHLFERNGFSSKPDVRVIDSQLLFKPMAAV